MHALGCSRVLFWTCAVMQDTSVSLCSSRADAGQESRGLAGTHMRFFLFTKKK